MCKETGYIHSVCDPHTICLPDSAVVDRVTTMEGHPKIIREDVPKKLVARDITKTLVVNLLGGLSCGKSTMAAGIFFELKSRNINAELSNEYAKDLVYEERTQTFNDQIYIFGKQYHRIFRLLGKVSVIVVDSPLLLTPIYDAEKRATLKKLVLEEHNKMWTYNVFLKRKKAFNPKGRNHNEDQSKDLDYAVADMLLENDILFETFEGTVEGKDAIVKKILMLLEHNA